jgi:hypothetical protein
MISNILEKHIRQSVSLKHCGPCVLNCSVISQKTRALWKPQISQAKHVIGFTFWSCVARMAYLAVLRFTHMFVCMLYLKFKICMMLALARFFGLWCPAGISFFKPACINISNSDMSMNSSSMSVFLRLCMYQVEYFYVPVCLALATLCHFSVKGYM